MIGQKLATSLSQLYLEDETAWLEEMARLAAERRFQELDVEHLSEFLADMSRRDKREVLSRLTSLLVHLLKWEHQPEQQSNSWRATIVHQRDELKDLLESGTLLNHANEVLEKAYERAVKQAALETGLAETAFPPACPFTLESVLTAE
jgi:hypothetical protein